MKTIVANESGLKEVAHFVISEATNKPIILLKGDLGAGKTTLVKIILENLGVNESVTSPTFNIVSTYPTLSGKSIHHFDLYRIKTIDELYEIGFEEYLDSGLICLIEWPEIAEPFFESNHTITIEIGIEGDQRIYQIQ